MVASASSWLQHHLLQLHGPLVYLVVVILVFVEVGIVIGFFIPGELAAIMGGVIAGQHRVNLVLMVVLVVAAAASGNFCGYELGKVVGPWLLSHRPIKGHPAVLRAQHLMARRGGPAVFIGRWIAVVRALIPGIAGASGMDLRIFGTFTIAGGASWGTTWVLAGYAAGLSYTKVVNAIGQWSLVAVGVIVAAFIFHFVWRKFHKSHVQDEPRTR